MNSTKLSIATTMAVALLASPATAYADEPVPTVDQVVAIFAELTDPNIPAMNKGNIVTPDFTPDEANAIDDHLHQMDGYSLPLNFIVTDIQPAPANFAGTTVATTGANFHSFSPPGPAVLTEEGGRWKLTHDSAMGALNAYWYNANRRVVVAR